MQVVWNKQNGKGSSNQGTKMHGKDLIDRFDEHLFIANLKAKTKNECLEELTDLFVLNKFVRNRDIVLGMLEQRENLGSTGIGNGVAVPHGRTTAAMDVTIAFGRSAKGLDFDAIDGEPVHLIFAVLAPPQEENNRYLPILGKLVEVVSSGENRSKLLQVNSFEELMAVIEEVG